MSPRPLLALWPVLWLAACGDKDGDGGDSTWVDADGDGYPAEHDCDDADAAVYPGAPELCNDRDDDCDDEEDEQPAEGPTWYLDADGDGAGTVVYPVVACTQPEGFVDNADDCNDGSAVSYPRADELCDGLDNDCDDEIDESPVDATTWYVDEDGDGYGDPSVPIEACQAPSVYVTNGDDCDDDNPELSPATVWYGDVDGDGYGGQTYTAQGCEAPEGHVGTDDDCDDADPEVHPGATEVCDEVDNNCDGLTDGADAEGAQAWFEDLDLDGYGTDAGSAVACEPPEGYAEVDGDCDDTVDTTFPGAPETCGDSVDNDCDGEVDLYCDLVLTSADGTWDGESDNDFAGYAVAAGDYDGDGIADIAAGAYGADYIDTSAGRAYVLLGPLSSGTTGSLGDAALIVDGAAENDYFGYAVGLGGDATGDGYGDVIFGAWGADADTSSGVGGAYLFAGPTTGTYTSDEADAIFLGDSSLDYLAQYECHTGADLDHDGKGDVVVGASGEDTPYSSGGVLAIFRGPVSGLQSLSEADVRVEATGAAHYVGFAMTLGDIDGDGLDDIAWGTSGDSAAYAVYGPLSADVDADDADVAIDGASASAFGSDIALGDFDGDGEVDLAVGGKYDGDGGTNAGAWFIFSGPLDGSSTDADYTAKIIETTDSRYLGAQYLQSATGDVDGDGRADLAFGMPSANRTGAAAGAVHLFLGPIAGANTVDEADMTVLGEDAGDAAGYGVALGDLDGDALDDLVVGARGWDTSDGRVYGVLGAGF